MSDARRRSNVRDLSDRTDTLANWHLQWNYSGASTSSAENTDSDEEIVGRISSQV